MRVLIAPGRFGPLSAAEAAALIGAAWREAAPWVQVRELPQADGRPGSAAILAPGDATAGVVETGEGEPLGCLTGDDAAWLDAAADGRRTGAAVRHLLAAGVRRFVLGAGGDLELDGGRGFVAGLTGRGEDVDAVREARRLLTGTQLTALVDDDRQLLGFQGAAFGAIESRGIDQAEAQAVEQRMGQWLDVVRAAVPNKRDLLRNSEIRPERQPGAGAGGGLPFVLAALGADVVDGAAHSARTTGLADAVAGSDLVVTATTVFDWRVLDHSVPAEVTGACAAAARPVVLLADEVHVGRREQMSLGLQGTYSLSRSGWMRSQPLTAAQVTAELPSLVRRVATTWTPRR